MATMLSGLRSFLRYLRDIRGLAVFDPAKVRPPKIPKREVEYLSKEELQRFLDAIPTQTQPGFVTVHLRRSCVSPACGLPKRSLSIVPPD